MGFLQQKIQIRDLAQGQRESKAPYLPFSGSNNGVVYVSESHISSVICIESGLGRDVQISKLFCTLPSPDLKRRFSREKFPKLILVCSNGTLFQLRGREESQSC